MEQHFEQIHGMYEEFARFLMRCGRLPMGSTRVGFWGTTILPEVHDFFRQIRLHEFEHVVDLGSGDGRVVLVASLFTNATGIEFDPYLVSVGNFIKGQLKHIPHLSRANLIQGNFFHHSLRDFDLVFINPDQPLDRGLEQKLFRELNGLLVVEGHHYHPTMFQKAGEVQIRGTPFSLYRR